MEHVSRNTMSFLLAMAALAVSANAAGLDYLPPSKGYNYEPPNIPFPTNNNPNAQPAPPGPTYRPPNRPPPPPPAPTPRPYRPPQQPEQHEHQHHDEHHHHEPGMPFDFAYSVNEDGNDYSHNAVSDGDVTRGEYRVALPDGRTQIVKYTADWKEGFNAVVTYEGQARYPDQPNGAFAGGQGGQAYIPPQQGGGYKY